MSPGTATLDITAAGGFAAASGPLTVGTFTAAVPATALYGGKHVLDITDLHVFDTAAVPAELPAVDDDAIHVAAFFGDNNGSRTYNAPDVTLIQRLIGQINTGFSAYQLADPLLLADITRNGQLQANDTASLQRVIGQVPVANVPALPTGITPPAASGADPTIYIPQDLAGSPGDTVTVPVRMRRHRARGDHAQRVRPGTWNTILPGSHTVAGNWGLCPSGTCSFRLADSAPTPGQACLSARLLRARARRCCP